MTTKANSDADTTDLPSIRTLTLGDLARHNRVMKERLDDSTDAMNGSEDMEFLCDDDVDDDIPTKAVRLSHLSLIAQDTSSATKGKTSTNTERDDDNDDDYYGHIVRKGLQFNCSYVASLQDDESCNGTYAKSTDDDSFDGDALPSIRSSFILSHKDGSTRACADNDPDYQR